MRAAAILILSAAFMLAALPSHAGSRYAPPQTIVSSHIGLMNELQKRGPYARAYGPDAGGQYLIIGPITEPYAPYPPPYHRRGRYRR